MSSAYQQVPEEGLEIITEIPGVEEGYYLMAFKKIDELPKTIPGDKDPDYNEKRYCIANKVYLVYERLYHKIARQIDYGEIKRWVTKNIKLVTLFLSDKALFKNKEDFPLEALWQWLNSINRADIGMSQTCMYKK